jgi:hypothetical protein
LFCLSTCSSPTPRSTAVKYSRLFPMQATEEHSCYQRPRLIVTGCVKFGDCSVRFSNKVTNVRTAYICHKFQPMQIIIRSCHAPTHAPFLGDVILSKGLPSPAGGMPQGFVLINSCIGLLIILAAIAWLMPSQMPCRDGLPFQSPAPSPWP